MNTEIYILVLKEAKNQSMKDFFDWLTQTPEFMELSDIEIELNFMIYSVAKISYSFAEDGVWGY